MNITSKKTAKASRDLIGHKITDKITNKAKSKISPHIVE